MPKLKKHNAPWSPFDVARLRKLANAKPKGRGPFSAREAAALMGRTTGAVKYKAMVEGISFHNINQPKGPQLRLARKRRKFGPRATLRKAA